MALRAWSSDGTSAVTRLLPREEMFSVEDFRSKKSPRFSCARGVVTCVQSWGVRGNRDYCRLYTFVDCRSQRRAAFLARQGKRRSRFMVVDLSTRARRAPRDAIADRLPARDVFVRRSQDFSTISGAKTSIQRNSYMTRAVEPDIARGPTCRQRVDGLMRCGWKWWARELHY